MLASKSIGEHDWNELAVIYTRKSCGAEMFGVAGRPQT